MNEAKLEAIREIIQTDAGGRGLRTDPLDNLITRTVGDFAAACRSIATQHRPSLAIVTGFFIPNATPPAAETDGPLGAVFLARALSPLGIGVFLFTDAWGVRALECGLSEKGSDPLAHRHECHSAVHDGGGQTPFRTGVVRCFPEEGQPWINFLESDGAWMGITHVVALERVGPSQGDGRCYSMRGRDITEHTAPAHRLLEDAVAQTPRLTTIGIGDGGNEIGMGKLPHEVIARNIPNGDTVACRVATDHLIVAGVSNWGAYGLAAGVRLLRGTPPDPALFDPDRERELLELMVERGPLVDGVTGRQEATVDGLAWERHAEVLRNIGKVIE